jgi:hypothetical protein
MHINLTHVEHAVGRLVDEEQNAVVVSSFHPLSKHKGLAAALWKARRSKSEQALDQRGGKGGALACLVGVGGRGGALGMKAFDHRRPHLHLLQTTAPNRLLTPPAARLGYHTITHTSVDPDVLLEELSLVADTLTHGITGG